MAEGESRIDVALHCHESDADKADGIKKALVDGHNLRVETERDLVAGELRLESRMSQMMKAVCNVFLVTKQFNVNPSHTFLTEFAMWDRHQKQNSPKVVPVIYPDAKVPLIFTVLNTIKVGDWIQTPMDIANRIEPTLVKIQEVQVTRHMLSHQCFGPGGQLEGIDQASLYGIVSPEVRTSLNRNNIEKMIEEILGSPVPNFTFNSRPGRNQINCINNVSCMGIASMLSPTSGTNSTIHNVDIHQQQQQQLAMTTKSSTLNEKISLTASTTPWTGPTTSNTKTELQQHQHQQSSTISTTSTKDSTTRSKESTSPAEIDLGETLSPGRLLLEDGGGDDVDYAADVRSGGALDAPGDDYGAGGGLLGAASPSPMLASDSTSRLSIEMARLQVEKERLEVEKQLLFETRETNRQIANLNWNLRLLIIMVVVICLWRSNFIFIF